MSDRALIVLLAVIVTIGSVATNIYIPALPAVRADFGVSVAEAQATFAVALLTFAIGMLCWGPISDRYGRRNAILAGVAVMSIGSAIGLLSPSIHWLIAGRAVQAFGTATGIVVARAVISDRFPAERMARTLAQLGVVAVIASGTAPVFGGLLTAAFGWRSVFVVLLLLAATVGWFTWRHLPETRPPTSHPPPPREMAHAAVTLLRTPLYVSCVLQASAAYAIFVVLISLAPYIMINALGRPATEYGFYYLFISIGYLLGNWGVSRFGGRGQRWAIGFGSALQLGSALVAVALAWLGVAPSAGDLRADGPAVLRPGPVHAAPDRHRREPCAAARHRRGRQHARFPEPGDRGALRAADGPGRERVVDADAAVLPRCRGAAVRGAAPVAADGAGRPCCVMRPARKLRPSPRRMGSS